MSALLDSDERVAEKDRLYRALDRMVEHKEALEESIWPIGGKISLAPASMCSGVGPLASKAFRPPTLRAS